MFELYGVEPETILNSIDAWLNGLHPEDKKKAIDECNAALYENQEFDTSFRVLHPDGKVLYLKANALVIKDSEGKPIRMIGINSDITEKKKTEDELNESRERFKALFDHMIEGVCLHEMIYDFNNNAIDYRILDVNENYENILGFKKVDIINRLSTEVYKTDVAPFLDVYNEALTTMKPINFETYFPPMDKHFSISAFSIGEKVFATVFEDITKRKKTELELLHAKEKAEKSEELQRIQKEEIIFHNERLESLLRISQLYTNSIQELLDFALNEAINLTESKIGYIYFYDEEKRQFILNTWSNEVMKECSVLDPQTVYDLDRTGIWGEAVRQRKPIILNNYQAENPLKKGTPEGHVQLSKFLTIPVIFDNIIVAVAGVANKETDYNNSDIRQLTLLMDSVWKISERINLVENLNIAKEKAEESESQVRALLDNAIIPVAIVGIDKTIKYGNDALCKLFGMNKENLADYEVSKVWKNIEERDKLVCLLIENGHITNYEAEFITFDKKHKTILLSSRLINYNNEQSIFSVYYDITDRKILENNLIDAKEKAEESDKLKSAFLQNMSHEIRTPLNGIIGFSSLLQDDDVSRDELIEYTTIIQNSGRRLMEIVCNVLDISKIETGQIEVYNRTFSLNTLMSELYNFFVPNADAKELNLYFNDFYAHDKLIIETDDSKLNQILSNLINNSIKFTNSGSIEFGYELQENEILFYVKDTGLGIPEDMKNRIFMRFAQINLEITRGYEGAGLGLAISKGLVELLGGKIWLESEAGKGTTFFFTIPYSPSNMTEKFPSDSIIALDKQKKIRILIAEDDLTSYQYLRKILKSDDFIILYAENGKVALDIVSQGNDIDLVLMDIKMPEMDGLEATKQIKLIRPDLPIIAQTAYAFSEERDSFLIAGCDDYIAKPVSKGALLKMIEKYTG